MMYGAAWFLRPCTSKCSVINFFPPSPDEDMEMLPVKLKQKHLFEIYMKFEMPSQLKLSCTLIKHLH